MYALNNKVLRQLHICLYKLHQNKLYFTKIHNISKDVLS